MAAAAVEHRVRLGFHNHDGELRHFDGEPTLLDRLLAEVPGLFLELDLGWAWYAGADPADLVTRAAGRAPLVHVKDFRRNGGEPSYCPVGDGDVGYERVVPAALAAGVEWLLVEQDQVDGPELEAAERSLAAVERFVGASR